MLGDRIKQLQEAKNIGTNELGRLAGVSASYISAVVRGIKKNPSIDFISKIAKALDVSEADLLADDDHLASIPHLPDAIPTGNFVKLPVIGTVMAGQNGLAYEDTIGFEIADKDDINGGRYFYLKVKGESMINDGIFPGDYALVREQHNVEYGELAIVLVNNEEGTIKRVYKKANSIILQSSNPAFPPRIFEGKDMRQVRIVGKVKSLIRKF